MCYVIMRAMLFAFLCLPCSWSGELELQLQGLQGALVLLEQQVEPHELRADSKQLTAMKEFFKKALEDYEESKIFKVVIFPEVEQHMKTAVSVVEKKAIAKAYADFLLSIIPQLIQNLYRDVIFSSREAQSVVEVALAHFNSTIKGEPLLLLGSELNIKDNNTLQDWALRFEGMQLLKKYVEQDVANKVLRLFFDLLMKHIDFVRDCMWKLSKNSKSLTRYNYAQEELMHCIHMLQKNGGIYNKIAQVIFDKVFKNIKIFERKNSDPNDYIYMLDILRNKYGSIAQERGVAIPGVPSVEQMTKMLLSGKKNESLDRLVSELAKVVNIETYRQKPALYQSLHSEDGQDKELGLVIQGEEELLGAIGRRVGRVSDLVFGHSQKHLSACSSAPKGIGNSTGTCFINADLQVWRAIYCIPEAQEALNIHLVGISKVTTKNPQFKQGLAKDVTDFLNVYTQEDPRELEKRIIKIQEDLEAINPKLKENALGGARERTLSGRTHVVMNILCNSITFYPSNIYANRDHFKSSIGFVSNDVDMKADFTRTWETGLITNENQKKRLKKLKNAQSQEAYIAIEIARAVGAEAFLGITKFNWPKVLIVSTTRFDKKTGQYIKGERIEPKRAGDIGPLESVIRGIDRVKFKTNLLLSDFGFVDDSPQYNLMAFTGKIQGHAMSVVQHDNKWYTCSNTKVIPVDVTQKMEDAGKKGFVEYIDFGKNQQAIPEILVYQRVD